MKKRKQPKTPKAPIKQPQAVAVSKRSEAPAWGWFKKLGYVGGGLGLILTVLRFWPQLSIEPTAAAERSNPISGYFKITNERERTSSWRFDSANLSSRIPSNFSLRG